MADYTSKYTGTQIDAAIDVALTLKNLRGIIKITADGPVAAVAGEDYPESSGSTVSVTGVLKGVADAETGEITIQQAGAGVDYQTPLKAGVDYAIPSAVANKQNKINDIGLLKGTGEGIVTAAEAGVDYVTPANVNSTVSTHNSNSSAHSTLFNAKQNIPASATVLPASSTALTANTIYAVATAVGTYAFTPPATGWAHGKFTTGSSASVSFAGTFLGAAPTIEASKAYEFDVFDGVWAVQEVVSA